MPDQPLDPETASRHTDDEHAHGAGLGWKHWGLMALCCLPMIAVVVLVALGVWGGR